MVVLQCISSDCHKCVGSWDLHALSGFCTLMISDGDGCHQRQFSDHSFSVQQLGSQRIWSTLQQALKPARRNEASSLYTIVPVDLNNEALTNSRRGKEATAVADSIRAALPAPAAPVL